MDIQNCHAEFNEIDMNKWKNAKHFQLYTQMIQTGFTVCVNLDVTKMYEYFKVNNLKFSAGYRYITLKLVNEREFFKIAYKDSKIGFYDSLVSSFVIFHEDDKSTSIMWVDFNPSFAKFYANYIEETEKYKDVHGLMAKPMMPPENCCMIGVLPWISFTSYSPVPFANPSQFFPVIESGKFLKTNDKVLMPFSIMVHHAVADGYQVSEFLQNLQTAMNECEKWAQD